MNAQEARDVDSGTCINCQHWMRRPWPNGLGWHGQGTCERLHVAPGGHLIHRDLTDLTGIIPLASTNAGFGCHMHKART